jgi:hypothetical protein
VFGGLQVQAIKGIERAGAPGLPDAAVKMLADGKRFQAATN